MTSSSLSEKIAGKEIPEFSDADLDAIEARAAAARPGPWEWYGNTGNGTFYLATRFGGRVFVMDFVRWGMRGAQPRFQVNQLMKPGTEFVNYEVLPGGKKGDRGLYREDFVGILHPDATFIAEARVDVPRLVGEIRRLRGVLAAHGIAEGA